MAVSSLRSWLRALPERVGWVQEDVERSELEVTGNDSLVLLWFVHAPWLSFGVICTVPFASAAGVGIGHHMGVSA